MGFWKNFTSLFKNEATQPPPEPGDELFEALIRGKAITRDMAMSIPKLRFTRR